MGKIESVSDYLIKVAEVCHEFPKKNEVIVFRGEPQIYPTCGMPGIFREEYLKNDPFFEKNILLEMKANKLSKGNNYLEMAIDAQHGGFPSRLLDVTFNCLIALYFACVSKPENTEHEKQKNGQVIIYKMDRAYCPTAANVINMYREMLENPNGYINEKIFETNHKLIDHIKVNSRIISQQGALILFQGNEWEPIPSRLYQTIVIEKEYKDVIAKQLDDYFGINTSYVYPEIDYAVNRIKNKAKNIVSEEFSIVNEIKMSMDKMKETIQYELSQIAEETEITARIDIVIKLEKKIARYKEDLINLCDKYELKNKEVIIDKYNDIVEYYSHIFIYYLGNEVKSCSEDLKMEDTKWKKN